MVFAAAILVGGIWFLTENCRPTAGVGRESDLVDFNWHVRPILSDRCFKCHGPDEKKREAGLRLDTEEGAFAALGTSATGVPSGGAYTGERAKGEKTTAPTPDPRYAIVPYHPEKSELIRRIYSTNPDSVMPAPDSHLSLNDAEKDILKRWIEQGAKWKKHWAFIVPEKTPLPTVQRKGWTRNEIDYFILQKLEQQGLAPSPETDKARLLRRASFDLTGLPPSPEALEHFLADDAPDAYERAVDSLLASPAYGERWAMYWMDLARYSDTRRTLGHVLDGSGPVFRHPRLPGRPAAHHVALARLGDPRLQHQPAV